MKKTGRSDADGAVSSVAGCIRETVRRHRLMSLLLAAAIAGTPLLHWAKQRIEGFVYSHGKLGTAWNVLLYATVPVVLLLASTANLVGDSYNPFIYFQF